MEKTPEDNDGGIAPAADIGSIVDVDMKIVFTKDEYHLATLGYKQEFFRNLGLFENW
jgi:hypothetical protein